MIKYRIYFFGFGGTLFDAYKFDVIAEDEYFDTMQEAIEGLAAMHGLRTDLTFTIMPVFITEDTCDW